MKITVLLPCFNEDKYLREAIESVLNQTYKDYELLIIDHSTTDKCEKVCEKYAFERNVKYLRYTAGASIASVRNFGVKEATGDYLLYLYHDDYLPLDALEKMSRVVHGRDGMYANAQRIRENGKRLNIRRSKSFASGKETARAILYSMILPVFGPTVLYKTSILKEYPSDEALGIVEDMDVLVRIFKEHHFAYLDDTTYVYRVYPGNYSSRVRRSTIQSWNMMYDLHKSNKGKRIYYKGKRIIATFLKMGYDLLKSLVWF